MKRPLFILLGVGLVASLVACKKNKVFEQQCKLYLLSDSTTSVQAVTQFDYDNQGRVSKITVTGQKGCIRTFQYLENNVVLFNVTDTAPGISMETDTLQLNSKGWLVSRSAYFPSSNQYYTERYSYDDAGISTGRYETLNGVPEDTMIYKTEEGDLISEAVKGQTTNTLEFSYYTDQSYVYGDPTDFRQQLYYGAYYYKNKHMARLLYSPGKSYRAYSYTYKNGRVIQSVLRQWVSTAPTDTVTHYFDYSYNCR